MFGEQPVKKLFAKKWTVKEEGLDECEQILVSLDFARTKETFKVACYVADKAISDKIFQITQKGLSLLETALKQHSDLTFEESKQFVARVLFNDLFHRIGDHNVRLRDRIE